MMQGLKFSLVLMVCLTVFYQAHAQNAPSSPAPAEQSKPADPQKPAAQKTDPSGNAFPEDLTTVPVLPAADTPIANERTYGAPAPLPGDDRDPARSPDDDASASPAAGDESSSSSLSGLVNVVPPPEDDRPRKKQATRQQVADSDLDVGKYYLERKNWKAALSRLQSALVLDPENPEVYWGLAEAERNLGDFVNARQHYLKLLDYDPEGPHGRQARKALKDPAIEAAAAHTTGQPVADSPKR